MAARRVTLPALLVLALLGLAAVRLAAPLGFVAPQEPAPSRTLAPAQTAQKALAPALGGAAASLLAAAPAHAFGVLFDEIIPYAATTSFCILWGIVLGFVLLRLQEAFPE
eukprot:CAMPEP_0171192378 /NCGR_PEP_ID=MMETSP0790-20130122/19840_1 /TAXON_ID=2925 /ORGANISM="Alexandrium catenella, Strain OF101" /LENGTH=109 /DNA_ID=CAMNT_0011657537 /DNA_START=65 /DNA_END=394 /DNA_ORIENTATION=+